MTVRLPGTPSTWLDDEVAAQEAAEFDFSLGKASQSGRYTFPIAATLIAKSAGNGASDSNMEERLVLAARDGSLPAYTVGSTIKWNRDNPFVATLEFYWDDLNKWLGANEPRITFVFPQPPTAPTEASLQDENAENEGNAKPTPSIRNSALFTKNEILTQPWPISGRFNFKRALTDVPQWLVPARKMPGRPGKNDPIWNPALVACCLREHKDANITALRKHLLEHFPESVEEFAAAYGE